MGSHKQNRKHKKESSSSESESSSSEDERTSKRKCSRRSKQSSSEESDIETEKRNQKSSCKIRKSKNAALERTRHSHREKIHSEELRGKYIYRKEDTDDVRNRSRSRDRDGTRQRRGDYHKHEERERKSNNKSDKHSETRERNDDNRSKREYDREKHEDRYKNKEFADRRNDKWSNENYRREIDGRNERRKRRSGSYDHANAKWGKDDDNVKSEKSDNEKKDKDKPNFGLSGKLTEERNTYRGVVIKYSEPPEARKPRRRWRLYPFKGEKALQTLYIHRESAYLIGRERKIVDLPVDHPSCSKQHAALQYRLVPFTREDGSVGKRVRPYLIDLESANGTFINNKKIEPKRYVELFEKDVVKFGFSSREYVLLHENSKDEAMDDDVKQEKEEEEEVKVKIEQKE